MKKNLFSICLFIFAVSFSTTSFAEEAITFNVKYFNASLQDAKRSAYRALLKQKWNIKKSNGQQILASYGEYETRIDFASFPEIRISYINMDEEESYPLNYLLTLKRNMQMTLVDCGDT